jgi:hydroxyquinol 1,2-dioxygenase
MRDVTEANLTDAVLAAMAGTPEARTRAVLGSLVRHLHAFIREVNLTEAEWLAGIQFLTATGQKCDAQRQEFILLSDTLGATTMKDLVNHRKPAGLTPYTILGPFHRDGAPELPLGANLAGDLPGEPVTVSGRVLGPDGEPLAGAALDVWHSDSEGQYDLQMPAIAGTALRGVFHTGADGRFTFQTIKPAFYPIPVDGPVGKLLLATGRHPYRPAHIHFIVSAAGYQPLTTELFDAADPYLDSDAVFGVRQSLIVPFVRHAGGYTVDFDFILEK